MPFDEDVYKAGVLRRQAACERRRYWGPSTDAREQQRERNKLLAAARPLKRKRHAEQLSHISNVCSLLQMDFIDDLIPVGSAIAHKMFLKVWDAICKMPFTIHANGGHRAWP